MKRIIDKLGRVHVSQKWMQHCTDSTAVITVNNGSIIMEPYNPEKHDLNNLLYRRLDDHARVKLPPDILQALGFAVNEQYHLYIDSENTAFVRLMDEYCDVCGRQTQTKAVLGRRVCNECFDILKRS